MKNIIYIIISLIILSCGQIEKKIEKNHEKEIRQVEKIKIDSSKYTVILLTQRIIGFLKMLNQQN